jgi:hypothetical protein
MARRARPLSNALKLAEVGVAVPQVVAHRVARMALAGPVLSARDTREFSNMVLEKQLAFTQSFLGMAGEMARLNQQLALAWFTGRRPSIANSVNGVLAKGLSPVHRKAVSNAKRLARTGSLEFRVG